MRTGIAGGRQRRLLCRQGLSVFSGRGRSRLAGRWRSLTRRPALRATPPERCCGGSHCVWMGAPRLAARRCSMLMCWQCCRLTSRQYRCGKMSCKQGHVCQHLALPASTSARPSARGRSGATERHRTALPSPNRGDKSLTSEQERLKARTLEAMVRFVRTTVHKSDAESDCRMRTCREA